MTSPRATAPRPVSSATLLAGPFPRWTRRVAIALATGALALSGAAHGQIGVTSIGGYQTQKVADTASGRTLNWAEKMFSQLEHDFGNVARGADVTHQIMVTNPYEETVRIVGVDKTCGCTAAKASRTEIPMHQSVTIELAMDTRKFMNEKKSNVLVTLAFTDKNGRISQETVRVPIRAFIRSDVVVEPGAASFGEVEVGAGGSRQLTIKYAGRPDWALTGVETGSGLVEATLSDPRRTATGSVEYDLTVALSPDAPIGEVKDRLILRTNDGPNQVVPVNVSATVQPDIVVTPSPLNLGMLQAGQTTRRTVVLKGKRPFELGEIVCLNHEDVFAAAPASGKKPVHVVPLTVTAPESSGELSETFEVTIVGRDEPITFTARGTVVQ